jgi:predicted RNase H-like HicB family nuclease
MAEHAPIDVVIYRDGDYWLARALNLPVVSFGDTPDEARELIKEAIELYLEAPPEEREPVRPSVDPRLVQIA